MSQVVEGKEGRRQISADERRRLLLAAALRVMKREGIVAATTRAICAEAGMPHGAFHYCFHTKKELYAALLASDIDIDLEGAWPSVSSEATPHENIRTLMLAFWAQIEADPDAQLVLFELRSFALRDPEFQELPAWEHKAALEKASGYVSRLADEAGLVYVQDERLLAEFVLTALDGIAWAWLMHRDNQLARASLDYFSGLASQLVRKDSAAV